MLYLTNINLNKNELQNAVIQNLAAAPSNAKSGQIYYDNSSSKLWYYNGTTWKPVGATYTLTDSTGSVVTGLSADGDVNATNVVSLTLDGYVPVSDGYVNTGDSLATAFFALDTAVKNAVAGGGEVNQNAYSNIKVGSTTLAANAKTDTIELAAGANITLTPAAASGNNPKKVTIGLSNVLLAQNTSSSKWEFTDADSGHSYIQLNSDGILLSSDEGPHIKIDDGLSGNITIQTSGDDNEGDIKLVTTNGKALYNGVEIATVNDIPASADKLTTARKIDGVAFDGTADITHYGTCSTAAATVAKTVSITGFNLVTGARALVRFTTTNTGAVASLTLNVNGTGAKSIKYRNGNLPSAGTLAANRTYEFVYDGTNYQLLGDLDTDTHYTSHLYVGAQSTNTNAAVTNPYLKLYDNTTARESHQIKGSGATSVASDASGNITISTDLSDYVHRSSLENTLQGYDDDHTGSSSLVLSSGVTISGDTGVTIKTTEGDANIVLAPDGDGSVYIGAIGDGNEVATQGWVDGQGYQNASQVQALIAGSEHLKYKVVAALPTTNIDTHTIYLVPKSGTAGTDEKDEYMYIDNKWELIGSNRVDLSNYLTKDGDGKDVKVSALGTSSSRTKLAANDTLSTAFGKLNKWYDSLSTAAWSGSYNDLSNKPTLLKSATGTLATTATTTDVTYTGTFLSATARDSSTGEVVMTEVTVGTNKTTFSTAAKPSHNLTLTVIYV